MIPTLAYLLGADDCQHAARRYAQLTMDAQLTMAPTSDVFTDDAKFTPFWWEEAPRPDHRQTKLPPAANIVVVGSGYAGLSAALTLARAGRDVVVVDADDPGFGASSRSGGMIGSGHRLSYFYLVERYGEKIAVDLLNEGVRSLDFTIDLIEREGLDCQLRRSGRFRGAARPQDYERIGREVDAVRRATGAEIDMIPASEQHNEIITERYAGGCVYHGHGGLHPGLFHLGLLARAEAAGATVVGHTRVRGIDGQRGAFSLRTTKGTIFAEEVVVATNGYTDAAVTPAFARSLIPVAAFVVATEALGHNAVKNLIPGSRMIVETHRRHCYYRPSPDGERILFGARAALHAIDPAKSGQRLQRFIGDVFPELRSVRISHSWTGFIAFSRDTLTHIGERNGIHFALACNGSGVAMAPYAGHKAALKLLGSADGRTAFDDHQLRAYPLYSGRPWFMPAVDLYYRLADWREN